MGHRSYLFALMSALLISSTNTHAMKVKDEKVIFEKLEDYNFCQTQDYSGEWCQRALNDWVEKHPADNFKAGKMTRLKMNAWSALPYFYRAFEDKQIQCNDEDVKMAVLSALDLSLNTHKEIVMQAKKIGLQTCSSQMAKDIATAASIGSELFKNSCHELLAQNALKGMKAMKCKKLEKK